MKLLKNSLRGKMLLLTILPVILIAILILAVGSTSFRANIISNTEEDMKSECNYLMTIMDKLYPGDYHVETIGSTEYKLYKGSYEITNENDSFDNMKASFDNEFTLFYGDITVKSTLRGANGERVLLTEAPELVTADVFEGETAKFYSDVTLNGESYFAYFEPIFNEKGTCIGMIGVYHSAADLNSQVRKALMPILILCIIAAIVMGAISVYLAQRLVNRILAVEKFTEQIASGRLDSELSSIYTSRSDELGSLAKSSAKMQKALKKLIEYDALTGIYNRRYANIKLKKIFEGTGHEGTGYLLAIGDIDFFKKFNDTYGHDAGDEVLRKVASILNENMHGDAFVARWGGEEFLFIFDHINSQKAKEMLEDTLQQIRDNKVIYKNQSLQVTMSFGLAKAWSGSSIDDVLKKADDNLYQAKENGRNQVIYIE